MSCIREEKASSSEGSHLDRRVFVSIRESSRTTGRGGDTDLRALALDGEAKNSVMWDCVGEGSRCLLDFGGVRDAEVDACLFQRFSTTSD
jgi:hypothetical protein